jgi:hypothetical protein
VIGVTHRHVPRGCRDLRVPMYLRQSAADDRATLRCHRDRRNRPACTRKCFRQWRANVARRRHERRTSSPRIGYLSSRRQPAESRSPGHLPGQWPLRHSERLGRPSPNSDVRSCALAISIRNGAATHRRSGVCAAAAQRSGDDIRQPGFAAGCFLGRERPRDGNAQQLLRESRPLGSDDAKRELDD